MTDLRIPIKSCRGALLSDQCDCLTPEAAAVEMAALLRERPVIVMRTGPAADAQRARTDAVHPLLAAMRAAATTRFDSKGQPR
ncbi:hypothetical protein [Actinoplanes sp. CA-252034]|uniref:hypothetical protein n=1 Tax=Actinoplanes sp. CA-252034 TaxID=3239906 RepID=UPI003D95160E